MPTTEDVMRWEEELRESMNEEETTEVRVLHQAVADAHLQWANAARALEDRKQELRDKYRIGSITPST